MRPGNPHAPYRTLYKDTVLTDREKKNVVFLDVIRRNGPIAKTDIARITKHNIVTVSNYVEQYIKQKLVLEKGLDISSGGRRPELVELNADWGYIVGVDISHGSIHCVVTMLNAKILHEETVARPSGHMETVLAEAVTLVRKCIEISKVDIAKMKGIGVGVSGVIDKEAGTVRDTDIARGMTVGSFESAKGILEKEFNVPVIISNDAALAALAEKKFSLRIDDENILYMYGDVGSGLIINNELFFGTSWSSGEIQLNLHGAADMGLPSWVYESNFFLSRGPDMGLVEDVKKLFEQKVQSDLWKEIDNDPEKITLDLIFKAIEKDDQAILDVASPIITLFGLKIAHLVNFLNPEVIVIGGGFEHGGDYVLNRVRSMVKKLVMDEASSVAKVIISRLGRNAVALGAASMVTQNIFAEI